MAETVRCGVCGELYAPTSKAEYDARVCPKCVTERARVNPDDAPAPESAEGLDQARLIEAVTQMERAVDAVYMNAMSISRLIGLAPPDVPRMCVMAACRMTERMIETYSRIRQQSGASGIRPAEAVAELERRKQEIGEALELLVHTLADGMTTAQTLQKSLALKVNVQ